MNKPLRTRILVVVITVISIYIFALFSEQYFLSPFFDDNITLDLRKYVSIFLGQIKSMAIASATILYFVEASDRKKQKHYEAWQIIESAYAAKTNKNNGSLSEALKYLASESVSLRGLELYHPERTKKLDLKGINLRNADLENADLRNIDFSGADFSNAKLTHVNFAECNLQETNFSHANLIGANLYKCDLRDATLNNVKLTDDHRKASLGGVILRDFDLVAANLNEKNLSGINLVKADLSGANLIGFKLNDANLDYTNLAGSNLSMADLQGASMVQADLSEANLSNADLRYTNLHLLSHEEEASKAMWEDYDHEYEMQAEIAQDEYFSKMSAEEEEEWRYKAIEHNQRRLPSFCGAILEGTRIRKGQLSKDSDLDLCLEKDQIAQCIIEE